MQPSLAFNPTLLPDVHGRRLSVQLTVGSAALLKVISVLKARNIDIEDLRYSTTPSGASLDVTAVADEQTAELLACQLGRIIDVLEVVWPA